MLFKTVLVRQNAKSATAGEALWLSSFLKPPSLDDGDSVSLASCSREFQSLGAAVVKALSDAAAGCDSSAADTVLGSHVAELNPKCLLVQPTLIFFFFKNTLSIAMTNGLAFLLGTLPGGSGWRRRGALWLLASGRQRLPFLNPEWVNQPASALRKTSTSFHP